MINGQCIYCDEENLLNEEHAFPDALRQQETPEWTINTHLCIDCNSKLGSELDAPLVGRSHIASVFDLIQRERGITNDSLQTSLYRTSSRGVKPISLLFSNPLYNNHILLHEPSSIDSDTSKCIIGFNALRPQLVLTQYPKEQKGSNIIVQNHLNIHSLNIERYTDQDAKADVLRLDENTHVFTPNASNYFLKNIPTFKSKFITDSPRTQYDFLVIYPEDEGYQKKVTEFLAQLEGGEKQMIPEEKSLMREVPSGKLHIIPDPKADRIIARAIAKLGFHCYLSHYYPIITGHEAIFRSIKDFICHNKGTQQDFVTPVDRSSQNILYPTTKHQHFIHFFVKNNNIGCHIDLFTGLLVGPFSFNIMLSGDPYSTQPNRDFTRNYPFYVHRKSSFKKRYRHFLNSNNPKRHIILPSNFHR